MLLTDPWFYAVALPAVVLFGLTKGGFSGASLPAMPLLALVVPPLQAAAIVLPVLMVQDVVTVYAFHRTVDRTMLRLMIPGALVGLLVGALTAAVIKPDQIRFGVGVLAFAFCIDAWFGHRAGTAAPRPHAALPAGFWGGVSGFTSFVVHAGGPPFSIYALPRRLPKEALSGTAAIFFAMINMLKVPAYLSIGLFTRETLALSAVLLPVAVVANAAGIWLVRRVPLGLFYKILYSLLFVLSLKLIYDGGRSFFASVPV